MSNADPLAEWRNVTAECEFLTQTTSFGTRLTLMRKGQPVEDPWNYRVRKIRMSESPFHELADAEPHETGQAFVIEVRA